MAIISEFRPGYFCWIELCSSDWQSAKPFYSQLFDWQILDQPIGEDCYYTMLQKEVDDVAAMYQMTAEQQQGGMPSHWLAYVAVDNVDECLNKANELGAEVLAGPHDVPGAGRMVMLKEPGGAVFALWQEGGHIGTQRHLEANTPYWFELVSKNSAKSRDFYSALFGWQIEVKDMGNMDYTLFKVNEQPVAGMLEMTTEWGEDIPPHWMIYIAVLDCDSKAEYAQKLGGEICVPPTDIPEVGRFSVITDPQGAVFSIIESAMDDIST